MAIGAGEMVRKKNGAEKDLREIEALVKIDEIVQLIKEPGGRIRVIRSLASLYGLNSNGG